MTRSRLPLSLGLVLLLGLLTPAWAQPEPAACAPDGALDYYRCRADDFVRRQPGDAPPSYYLDYGDRYVRRFSEETRPLLSPAGQAWLDRVRTGLQRAIESERVRDSLGFALLERDSPRFLDFAYDTHPRAYLGAGLSQLPLRDLLIIGSTPDARDLLSPRGRRQVLQVLKGLLQACRDEGLLSCLSTRVVRELRDRRRLFSERLRLRPTGSPGRWLTKRLIDWAIRKLKGTERASLGLSGGLKSRATAR